METLTIKPGRMTLEECRKVWANPVGAALDEGSYTQIEESRSLVSRIVERKETVYGVNTGFGLLATTRIPDGDLSRLQRNIVLSHAAGMGDFLDDKAVRLIMVLKINSLARGYSGVGVPVVEMLLEMVNRGLYPLVPEKGSVGASGDLAPLAHLAAALIGEGNIRTGGEVRPAAAVLKEHGFSPLTLGPKEGLALLNGTQVSTGLALDGLFRTEELFNSALVIGAMSVDAAKGTDAAFDERIHAVRGHSGQIECAGLYRSLLAGSEIRKSHLDCNRVQDPYSLRCQPQVMGACLDQMRNVARTLEIESNAVSDNPLVFSDSEVILSGGNFHAEPVAFAADNLALCIAEIGALAERRTALLIDRHLSELPPFLVEKGGLNSGFMIPQVTAAALASENKSLAHPASVDSLPTSANQEDHVSMAAFAARRLKDMAVNTAGVLAVEYLCAAQGIDFRRPLKTSRPLEKAVAELRKVVPFYAEDRLQSPDMEKAKAIIENGYLDSILDHNIFALPAGR